MLALRGQDMIYIIVDALDECPCSFERDTGRERILEILKELVESKFTHLRVCVASRPEVDIREAFEALSAPNVSIHDQTRQIEDIVQYVKSVVHTDTKMQKWPEDVKASVIDTLAKNGGGMYVIIFTYCTALLTWRLQVSLGLLSAGNVA
jgi:hypothetical protein